MLKKRRRFSPEFKFRVALAAAQGQRTLNELAVEYAVHPNQQGFSKVAFPVIFGVI